MHPYHFAILLPLACGVVPAQQPLAVSPADRASLEGSSFTHFPLGRANARMQTLHVDVPGGTLVSGHAYRRDAAGVRGRIDGLSCDLQVTLSMSPSAPTQASATFATNRGSAPVVVLPRTVVTFPATDRPMTDPAPTYELAIPYQVPFLVPPQGGTLCVEVEIFGNQTPAGANRNVSLYLDAHENYADGRAEQPGYRTGQGCTAPGNTAPAFATLTLWHRLQQMQMDVSLRNGVPDAGNGLARAFLMLGTGVGGATWPARQDCTLWSTLDVWFALPGAPNAQGDYDGSLAGLPVLPPGFRLWCQAGSVDLGTGALAFSDATTVVTPPPGPLPIPTSRIVNSTDRTATTGAVAYAVPVMAFF